MRAAGAVQHRSEAFARWGRLIWRRPVVIGGLALAALVALAFAGLGLRTAMPTTGVLPADPSIIGMSFGWNRPTVRRPVVDMIDVIHMARDHALAAKGVWSVFEWWERVYAEQKRSATKKNYPPLLWGFGVSFTVTSVITASSPSLPCISASRS